MLRSEARWASRLEARGRPPRLPPSVEAPPSAAPQDEVGGFLLLAQPRRGRVARDLEALAGVGDGGAVDPQDREVLRQVIADQQVFAVGREQRRLGQAADVDL